MRIIYAPIFEQGSVHDVQFAQKRGLYTAMCKAGHSVIEYDYLSRKIDEVSNELLTLVNLFKPDMILSQLHGGNILTPEQIREIKSTSGAFFCNWSGDSWAHSLTAQPILDMAREFDLQLVAAPDALPTYEANGINAAYWNIAYEPPVVPLPDMPTHDVVFLANVINEKRRALMEFLKGLEGVNVGIYGDWEHADGRNVYDFAAGEALYRNATLAIADNTYQDQSNYVSNRPMQAMGARCLVLHQHVPKMEELTGWVAGEHYIEWHTLEELGAAIRQVLQAGKAPYHQMIERAHYQIIANHTWDARVKTLFSELLPKVRERA
jgi:hypothetical protein